MRRREWDIESTETYEGARYNKSGEIAHAYAEYFFSTYAQDNGIIVPAATAQTEENSRFTYCNNYWGENSYTNTETEEVAWTWSSAIMGTYLKIGTFNIMFVIFVQKSITFLPSV